jgi:p-aminobenzoyl-glutamate transporter AbgT
VTLGTDDFETIKSGVIISSKNKEIKIQSKVELIDKVMVYDVSGKLIQEKKKIENMELTRYKCTRTGFIVKVFLINGTTVSKKSFIRNPKQICFKSHSLLRMGFFHFRVLLLINMGMIFQMASKSRK